MHQKNVFLAALLITIVASGCKDKPGPAAAARPTTPATQPDPSRALSAAAEGVHHAIGAAWARAAGVTCVFGCVEKAAASNSATERVKLLRDACVLDHPDGCEELGKALRLVPDPGERKPRPLLTIEQRIGALEDLEYQCKNGQRNLCWPVSRQLHDPIAAEIVARSGCEAGALSACRFHQLTFGHTDFDARGAIVDQCRAGDDAWCAPLIREKDVEPTLLAYLNAQCDNRGAFCSDLRSLVDDPQRRATLEKRRCRTSIGCDVEDFRPRTRRRFHELNAGPKGKSVAVVNAECDSRSVSAGWALRLADVSACGALENVWVQWTRQSSWDKPPVVLIHGASKSKEACLRPELEKWRRADYTQCYGELRTKVDDSALDPVDDDVLTVEPQPDPRRPQPGDYAGVECPPGHTRLEHPAEKDFPFGATSAKRDIGCYDWQGLRSGPTRLLDADDQLVRFIRYSNGEAVRDIRWGYSTMERTTSDRRLTVQVWDKNGVLTVKTIGGGKSGKESRERVEYYPNGAAQSKTMSYSGLPAGAQEHWTLDGTRHVNHYDEGLRTGRWEIFHGNGQLAMQKQYDSEGLEQGPEKRWDAAGTLRMQGQWKDARRTGTRTFYGADGELRRTETWENDVLTSVRLTR